VTDLPVISVVIPCLNRAHYLTPTIDSILQQDYPHIECIVVDGNSTDDTVEILKSYGHKIKWISEPDRGHADAINKGWRMSQGEILAWLNADDLWETLSAASQVAAYFQAHPDVDLVYGDCGEIDAEGNLVGVMTPRAWDLEEAVVNCDHVIFQPAAFIRRSIIDKVGDLDVAFYQKKDHELWLRIGLAGNIKYFPALLAHARNIKGLSYDGKTAAPACIQVTKKFYSLSHLPSNIKHKKRRAFSESYLQGILYAFLGGPIWKIIFYYTIRAVLADPTNIGAVIRQLSRHVAAGANDANQSPWTLRALKYLDFPRRVVRKINNLRKRYFSPPRIPNLFGDRFIENSWIAAHMPSPPGEALDFGSGDNYMSLMAAQRGFNVTAVDLEFTWWPYLHPKIRFIRGDVLRLPFSNEFFDLIINCSAIEHVGLAGRYGITENCLNGDLAVMAHLWQLLEPNGVMLLTIPVGQDAVQTPVHRIYGPQRLPQLLKGYSLEKQAFWVKDGHNRWISSDKETALSFKASGNSFNGLENIYALGCFVLRKGTKPDLPSKLV